MKDPIRYKPELGRQDVNPYAMMISDPNGDYVSYKEYLKLKDLFKNLQKECDDLWEKLGRD